MTPEPQRLERVTQTSPLWMVMQDPNVTRLVDYLQRNRRKILSQPGRVHTLHFSRHQLERTREDFNRNIRRGQAKLHSLCALLCQCYFDCPHELKSVVIGEVDSTRERFTLIQTLPPQELYNLTDRELGKQLLSRLRFHNEDNGSGRVASRAQLVANFVEYQPMAKNPYGIHKIISRIKAEQELWNKVVDEIFDLDTIFEQDKQLRQMSRYVKDVFGMKIVVSEGDAVRRLHESLLEARWTEGQLARLEVPVEDKTRSLEFLETKDYLSNLDPKDSGWQALKSVVRWWDATVEIQIQPLYNYYRELERFNQESHASFKARREELREKVAEAIPLYGYYRELLRWLFRPSGRTPAPTFPSVVVEVEG